MRPPLLLAYLAACAPSDAPETAPVCIDSGGLHEVCAIVRPDNALLIDVLWTTDTPGTSWVSFGETEPTSRLGSDDLTLDHHVVLYGLRGDRDLVLQVQTDLVDGSTLQSEAFVARTDPLPEHIPVGVLDSNDPSPSARWTLVNISNRQADWPASAVIYDEWGEPVWYFTPLPNITDFRGDIDVSLTSTGTILMGGSGKRLDPVEVDLQGVVRWDGPEQVSPFEQHHHFQSVEDGTYVFLRHASVPGRPEVYMDELVQIGADHNELWSWNAVEHLVAPAFERNDYTHMNSATWTDDAAYINSRNLNALFKIDRATGEIVWELGARGDFARTNPSDAWFQSAHDPELQPDGTWLIYDNEGAPGEHSRVTQWVIDEQDMTAHIAWAFPGNFDIPPWYTEDWHSDIWGDADRLDSGNVLITAGTRDKGGESRVFEVTWDGEVVWALRLPTPEGGIVGIYRAQRIPIPDARRQR